jgi:ribosomal subunit interface protein
MDVLVSGKNVDLGEALRSRIVDETKSHIGKYFDRGETEVIVRREGHSFFVDGTIRLHSGASMHIQGSGADAHAAFDAALQKADKRMRRYKEKLKDHHPMQKAAETARVVVLQPSLTDEDDDLDSADDDGDVAASGGAAQPMVIAERSAPIRNLTVSMAVLELEVSNYPVLMFRNVAHGGLSVVYRRPDGNIGWIDPERTSAPQAGVNGTGSKEHGAKGADGTGAAA